MGRFGVYSFLFYKPALKQPFNTKKPWEPILMELAQPECRQGANSDPILTNLAPIAHYTNDKAAVLFLILPSQVSSRVTVEARQLESRRFNFFDALFAWGTRRVAP